ncbi:hypothetical protein Q3G72_006278 [Acer saccharum]|nr:hypothetical protein Q3G72_006278 [Acer saccharum]
MQMVFSLPLIGKMTLLCLFIISVLLHFTPLSQFMENEPATAAESSTTATILLPLDPVEEALSPPWPLLDDENVVAMTEKSYTDYMDKKRGVVLFFYDSNCPTCRKLAPEYAAAAEMLKGDEAVTFGMVDAYESARKFFIPRYPTTCSLFPEARLSYYDFQEMESTSITKMEDAQRIFNAETHLVLGFLDDLEGSEIIELAAVSQPHSNINFYQTTRADVAEFFHLDPQIKRPALIFLETVSLKYALFDGPLFTRVPIFNFVSKTKLLLFVTFVIETAQRDIHFEHPTKQVWLLAPPDDNSDEIISTFNKVQDTLKETIPAKVAPSFVYMKMNFGEAGRLIISDDLEISEQVPIIIAYTGSADGEKYILNRELTFDNIKAFTENFVADKISNESSADAISETLLRLPSRFLSNFPSIFLFPHAPQGVTMKNVHLFNFVFSIAPKFVVDTFVPNQVAQQIAYKDDMYTYIFVFLKMYTSSCIKVHHLHIKAAEDTCLLMHPVILFLFNILPADMRLGSDSEELVAASRLHTEINFYRTASANVAELFLVVPQVKRPALILMLPGKYYSFDGQFTRSAIAEFVSTRKLPPEITFTNEGATSIFQNPLKQLWLFAAKSDPKVICTFEEVAEAFRGKVVAYNSRDLKKTLFNGELTLNNIKCFAEDFLKDELLRKSDPASETILKLPSQSHHASHQLHLHM